MKLRLPIYTIMHFLVDLTCIYRLYAQVMPLSGTYRNWLLLVLLYNFLAFALPAVMGLLADLTDSSDTMAALGCILTAVPVFFGAAAVPAVIAQGIGNGLFHVGAGRRVLMDSHGKFAHSGIFISSGAIGVFLGTFWKNQYSGPALRTLAAVLALCAAVLLMFGIISGEAGRLFGHSTGFPRQQREKRKVHLLTVPVVMILLVVLLRSFYGHCISYDWKNTALKSFLFTLCIAGGKAAGGIAADRIGVKKTSVLSLGGAALLVLFSADTPVMGYGSIFLFNMTMPLTLGLIAGYMKQFPGLAFGALMAALFAGTLPDLIFQGVQLTMLELGTVSLLSLLFLLLAIEGTGSRGRSGKPAAASGQKKEAAP